MYVSLSSYSVRTPRLAEVQAVRVAQEDASEVVRMRLKSLTLDRETPDRPFAFPLFLLAAMSGRGATTASQM